MKKRTSWQNREMTWAKQEEKNGPRAGCKMSEKQSVKYTVHVREGGGELNDMQRLEDGNTSNQKSGKMVTRGSENERRSSVGV